MKRLFVLLIMSALILTGCQNTYCPPDEAEASLAELERFAERWDDAMAVANSTARMSLPGPISTLQEIKRDANALAVPECLEKAQQELTRGMDYAIDGFIAFMAQERETEINRNFNVYRHHLDQYLNELIEIYGCMPKCKAP